MRTLRQAAQMALEALSVATTPLARDRQTVLQAQAALRAALTAPENPRLVPLDDNVLMDALQWIVEHSSPGGATYRVAADAIQRAGGTV